MAVHAIVGLRQRDTPPLVLGVARDTLMGTQLFPSLAETGLEEAIDRVAVIGSLVTGHAVRITYGKPSEVGGHFTPTNGMAQIGLNLLAEAAWCVFMAGRAGKLAVSCIHGSFRMKPLPDGKHGKRQDRKSQTEADRIGAVLPFPCPSKFRSHGRHVKLRARNSR
ncbi:protein of unknown function [Candidatus Methylomirabilis oxygeniifera]|uniref:Uncharacterized protein n=1 Tax=Methylomirabilis oxygeniifera TaxID=671143 RepID=D5MIW3_METO1|nr:protein of unknown function [Candidatus Methylomirabilis oxyfera]